MLALLPALVSPPNVVLILADDLGYGDVGAFGQKKIPTPNLDRLAREGMRLTRFYSNSPVCAPTRCSLLTGKHQGRAAIRGNKEIGGWGLNEGEGQMPLPSGETTIAETLRTAGYATAAVGKWGLGGPATEGRPTAQGFDFFFGYLCQRQAHNYFPTYLWRNDDVFLLTKNRYFSAHPTIKGPITDFSAWTGEQYSPDLMDDQAAVWLRSVSGKRPFFLYYASTLPHVSLQAPSRLVNRFPKEWDPQPYLAQQGYTPTERPHATYAAMIAKLDESVGRILDELRATGHENDTIVVFTSDNGPAEEGGTSPAFFDSAGGLRGQKRDLWEGGVRVPTIVRWPGHVAAGKTIDDAAQLADLFPTFAELAHAKTPKGLTGRSLVPLLTGKAASLNRPYLYWEFCEKPGQSILFGKRWKAIRPQLAKSRAVEIYDLQSDPGERHDLAAQRPDLVAQAERIFLREHVPNRDFPLPRIDPPKEARTGR